MTWYVIAFDDDAEPDDEVWTLSQDPSECEGWNTDGGQIGYGLTKTDAEFLANAANEKLERMKHP